MTTIAVPPRRNDNLTRRWWRTGRDHARAHAPALLQSKPVTATFNDNLNHQAEPLLHGQPVINRLEGLRPPTPTPAASAKSP